MSKEGKSGIQWGGLIKGLVAAASIVAGVELMFPGFALGVVAAAKGLGVSLAASFAAAPAAAAATTAPAASSTIAPMLVGLARWIGGGALVIAGVKYFTDDKPAVQNTRADDESFTAREDMRRMQALMMARMQAQGYQPAMAAAQER